MMKRELFFMPCIMFGILCLTVAILTLGITITCWGLIILDRFILIQAIGWLGGITYMYIAFKYGLRKGEKVGKK